MLSGNRRIFNYERLKHWEAPEGLETITGHSRRPPQKQDFQNRECVFFRGTKRPITE